MASSAAAAAADRESPDDTPAEAGFLGTSYRITVKRGNMPSKKRLIKHFESNGMLGKRDVRANKSTPFEDASIDRCHILGVKVIEAVAEFAQAHTSGPKLTSKHFSSFTVAINEPDNFVLAEHSKNLKYKNSESSLIRVLRESLNRGGQTTKASGFKAEDVSDAKLCANTVLKYWLKDDNPCLFQNTIGIDISDERARALAQVFQHISDGNIFGVYN